LRTIAMLSLGNNRLPQVRRLRLFRLVPMLLVFLLVVVVVCGCGAKGGGY
jgi:hypothetical protein